MKTPICDFVRDYRQGDWVRFHMPGHKGKPFLGMEAMDLTEIAGADSLGYLSLENLHQLAPDAECGFCEGCFTGKYPIDVD